VVGKDREGGRGRVKIKIKAINQRGEALADGIAIAELPDER
jgi:hypothetical protein